MSFVTQNPIDIPEEVAGQLGNRVQHALRAFTKRDQRAIKAAAETFRINTDLDTEEIITQLKVGEALVSTLDEEGAPTVVQRTLIAPPRSRLGPVTAKERAIIQSVSPFDGKYDEAVDRESAEEILLAKAQDAVDTAEQVAAERRGRSRQAPAQDEEHVGKSHQPRHSGRRRRHGGRGGFCHFGQKIAREPDGVGDHLCRRINRDRSGRAGCWPVCAELDWRFDAMNSKWRIAGALGASLAMAGCIGAEGVARPGPLNQPATVVVAFDGQQVTPLTRKEWRIAHPAERSRPTTLSGSRAFRSRFMPALAALRLADDGLVDLDTDVSRYLGWTLRAPQYPDNAITLRQLLSHRSGLRDDAGYVVALGESLREKLGQSEAWYEQAPPGEAPLAYANIGSALVATVLEAASGERYDALLDRTVFMPLSIEACSNWIGCSDTQRASAVVLYRDTGELAATHPQISPTPARFPWPMASPAI